ncbi:MAG: gliding motility-associated ABC transporter permease subunit GldF [Marinifilaceae bacterium]
MLTLLLKEFRVFFSSLIAYVVITVFLVANGLFVWVFPGEMNLLDVGYANLDTMFALAPWLYLFLVPAVCMRLFADEQKAGTMELLLTRPLSDMKIVFAKYLAGLLVVFFSLVPTLLYFYSVYQLGSPVGNLDAGAIWGSYIGLFLLGAVYVSIGVFASSLTENQVVAFVLGLVGCFLLYSGFEYLGQMESLRSFQNGFIGLGIQEHYHSISRGIIDSRDLVYFVSVVMIFLLMTRMVIQSRKW